MNAQIVIVFPKVNFIKIKLDSYIDSPVIQNKPLRGLT